MSSIVPSEPQAPNLIFEPTESVSGRALEMQRRVDELHQARNRQRTWMIVLGTLLVAAILSSFFIWLMMNQQASAAAADRDQALEQLEDAEAEFEAQIQTKNEELETLRAQSENLRQQARFLAEYEPVARLSFEVKELQDALDYYRDAFEDEPTPGLDRENTLELDVPEAGWTVRRQEAELRSVKSELEEAEREIKNWMIRESSEVPAYQMGSSPFD